METSTQVLDLCCQLKTKRQNFKINSLFEAPCFHFFVISHSCKFRYQGFFLNTNYVLIKRFFFNCTKQICPTSLKSKNGDDRKKSKQEGSSKTNHQQLKQFSYLWQLSKVASVKCNTKVAPFTKFSKTFQILLSVLRN